MNRKKLKKNSKTVLRKHYLKFVAICLIASFFGIEFTSSLSTLTGYNSFQNDYINPANAVTNLVGIDTLDFNTLIFRFSENETEQNGKSIIPGIDVVKSKLTEDDMLGRSSGVLAQLVNLLASDSISMAFLSGVQSLVTSKNIVTIVFVALSLLVVILIWMFFQNTYIVTARRIFLEGRIYSEIPMQRYLFLFRIKRFIKACWSMLVYKVLYILWCFTIVGIFTKRYSYAMVPYIIAENPDIKAIDAITLSKRMMYGHRWELFKLDLSFAGWAILGLLTAGITNIVFLNPYILTTYCEFYVRLRAVSILEDVPCVSYLDDRYLYDKAPDALIGAAYADVIKIMKKPLKEIEKLKGVRGFFANVFGVIFVPSKKEIEYEISQQEHIRIKNLAYAVNKQAYPYRLYKIQVHPRKRRYETIMYMRHYTVWSLVILFFVFSVFGYTWEVILHLLSYGEIVNRGVLHGPWLPIYGSGAILILLLLNKLRKYPVAEFFATMALCGTIEYFTSVYLEYAYNGTKWWDYRGYFLNLNGRICAEGLLLFGVTGVTFVYVIAPILDNWIKKIKYRILIPLCISLLIVFGIDVAYSYNNPNVGMGVSMEIPESLD